MKLEDLASVYVGEINLLDRDNQVLVVLDCDSLKVRCWAGIVPSPSVLMAYADVYDDRLAVVLDCDVAALCRFHIDAVERFREICDNRREELREVV